MPGQRKRRTQYTQTILLIRTWVTRVSSGSVAQETK